MIPNRFNTREISQMRNYHGFLFLFVVKKCEQSGIILSYSSLEYLHLQLLQEESNYCIMSVIGNRMNALLFAEFPSVLQVEIPYLGM